MPDIIFACPPNRSEVSLKSGINFKSSAGTRRPTLEPTVFPDPHPQMTEQAKTRVEERFWSLVSIDDRYKSAFDSFTNDTTRLSHDGAEGLIKRLHKTTADICNAESDECSPWIKIT